MKTKKSSAIVKAFNRIINVRAWFDFDRIKSFTVYLLDGFKKFFIPQKKIPGESFEVVMARMKITEADLVLKERALWRLSVIMVTFAGFILLYALYNLIYGYFAAGILSLVVMLIALVLAFRYHFWYFQIKKRKLGCTLQEWYKQGLRGEHS